MKNSTVIDSSQSPLTSFHNKRNLESELKLKYSDRRKWPSPFMPFAGKIRRREYPAIAISGEGYRYLPSYPVKRYPITTSYQITAAQLPWYLISNLQQLIRNCSCFWLSVWPSLACDVVPLQKRLKPTLPIFGFSPQKYCVGNSKVWFGASVSCRLCF